MPRTVIRSLLLAALLSLPVLADSNADEADFRFRRGAKLYGEGKTEEALSEFLASNRLVANRNVAFNIARCFEQLKRYNEAYRWYVEMLGQRDLPPDDRKAVEAAIGRLGNSLALVRIESDPPGATVYIDRKNLGARGQTPVTLALPRGNAHVLLELDGYRPVQTDTSAETAKLAEVHLTLERILGTLNVAGEPAPFEVRVDTEDSPVELTAPGSLKLVPGQHRLFVTAPGTVPQQLDARVVPDGETHVSFRLLPLPPPSGALIVKANLDGALVRVDGQEAGFTPAVIDKVRVGMHKVEVLAEGREPLSVQVDVKQDERMPIDVRLRYALPRVVAAERQLTRAQDAPASITIISYQEIRGFGYQTLAEALRPVRGLFISDDRDYQSLGVRGFSPPGTYNNRVLVLADGHITNDISLGQGFIGRDFDTDLNDVERIEIVRGPGSVLYGSAAYLAVVNVVHRSPAIGMHANGGITLLNENAAGAVVSAAAEGRWASLHAGVFHTDGEQQFHTPSLPGFATGLDGEDAAHADLRAHYGELTLYGSVNDRSKSLPTAPFDTVFGLPGTSTHDTRYFAELNWLHPFPAGGGIDARISLDGRKHDARFEYRGVTPGVGYPGTNGRIAEWTEAELRARLPAWFGNDFFVGGEIQDVFLVRFSAFTPAGSNAGLGSATPEDLSETIYSVYAGDDFRLIPRVTLSAAVRIDDHHASFGVVANPRLALVAQPYDGGNTKIMYGHAYRAPSFYERFFENGTTEVPGNRCDARGCTQLQPETIRTGEFEHTHSIGDAWSITVAGYFSRIQNILRLASVGGGKFAFGNRTSSLSHTGGIEAEVRWQPEPGAVIAAWYSFAHVQNDRPAAFIVPNVPTHTAALRALWPVARELFSASTELVYGSTRYTAFVDSNNLETEVGEQLFWNIGFTGTLGRGGPRFQLLVQNILDQKPLIPAGLEVPFAPRAVPQVGRMFRATIGGAF